MTTAAGPEGLRARLRAPRPVVLDGATGECLRDRGVDIDQPLWGSAALLDARGRALNGQLHADYVAAGAEIVIANTHNLGLAYVERHLVRRGLDPGTAPRLLADLNAAALALARGAHPAWLAGCIASPDVPYSPRPTLTPAQVSAGIEAQWAVMTRLRPDLVIFEMLTTESDVRGVADRTAGHDALRGAGLVCDPNGDLLSGFAVADAVDLLADAGFEIAFVQCTRYPWVDPGLARLVEACARRGLVPGVYANDGRQWDGGGWHGARVTPEAYAAYALSWVEAGARIVGGCCGTSPAHIEAVNRALQM